MARLLSPLLTGLALLIAGCASTPAPARPTAPPSQTPAQQAAPPPTATPTPNPLILPPATTPSSVGICQQQLSFGADGDASPLFCQDGAVNVLAWRYFQSAYPAIFALGAYATPSQIQQVTSKMAPPFPDADAAYCLAKAYYGWSYAESLNPAATQQGGQYGALFDCSNMSPFP